MCPQIQTDPLERAREALREEHWEEAAELARLALRHAELMHEEPTVAVALFILGMALAGPVEADGASRGEAARHLGAALPKLLASEEHDLAGETHCLLGSLALVRARELSDVSCMDEAAGHYREAVGCFVRGEDLESRCVALHNLGLCLGAQAGDRTTDPSRRAEMLENALECFHQALDLEIECGLGDMTDATEREREMAQEQLDELKQKLA